MSEATPDHHITSLDAVYRGVPVRFEKRVDGYWYAIAVACTDADPTPGDRVKVQSAGRDYELVARQDLDSLITAAEEQVDAILGTSP